MKLTAHESLTLLANVKVRRSAVFSDSILREACNRGFPRARSTRAKSHWGVRERTTGYCLIGGYFSRQVFKGISSIQRSFHISSLLVLK